MAVVIVASPRNCAHSSNPLLEVIISEVRSDIEDSKPKNRLPSQGESGMKPTSSTTIIAAFRIYLIRFLLVPENAASAPWKRCAGSQSQSLPRFSQPEGLLFCGGSGSVFRPAAVVPPTETARDFPAASNDCAPGTERQSPPAHI